MQGKSLEPGGIGKQLTIGAVGLDSRCDQQRSLRKSGPAPIGYGEYPSNSDPSGWINTSDLSFASSTSFETIAGLDPAKGFSTGKEFNPSELDPTEGRNQTSASFHTNIVAGVGLCCRL